VALSCAALCASCAVGPVELEPAELPDDVRDVCDRLLAELPSTVAGEERRDVTPYGSGAAWGDPPVTLRCGTTDAQGLDRASACQVVDGVGWYAEELERGYRFTTIGRLTYVEVVVPDAVSQPSAALVDLASAVGAHVPEVRPCV
jgi:hypothetical protein